MKYQVIIYYTEPLFQEKIESNKTYDVLFEYALPPGNEERAKEMALKQFRWNEANRMVRWSSRVARVEVRCEAGQKIAYVQDIVKCEGEREAAKSALVNNSEVNARVNERRKTPLDITARVERREATSQPFWQTAKIWLLWLWRILWLRGRRSISLLLPYYLDEIFVELFQDDGFEVLWGGNREQTEKIIMENMPDLAIEWRHGDDDFPIRDLLRKHGRQTPVILALNWGGPLPDDPREIDCAGYWKMSDLRQLMSLFYDVLPQEKRHILARLCAAAGVGLKPVN
jgi:hypothetical protein